MKPLAPHHNIFRHALVFGLVLLLAFPPAAWALFGEFTIKDEIELGNKFRLLIRSRMPIVEDPEITGYVSDLVKRLLAAMPPQPFEITSEVILHNALNAFAIPGGHVFVHTGLILGFEHESEVAGVLAHEMAHVSQRHVASRIEKGKLVNLVSLAGVLASIFVGSGDTKSALAVGSLAAGQSAMLKYSREDEREADNVGMNYLVDAGFPPKGLYEGLEHIRRKKFLSGSAFPTYLSTHPGVDERIGYLEQRVARLPENVVDRPDDDTRFHKVQMLIRARFTSPEQALAHFESGTCGTPCLNALGRAIVQARLNRVNEADQAFQEALACAPQDSLWAREAGRFYYQKGDFPQAARYLQQATITNPRDLMALFYYARLQADTGHPDAASTYFERVLARLPEDSEVRYHYGRLLGGQGRYFQAHVQLAYSALYANDRRQTDFHLRKAKELVRSEQDKQDLEGLEKALKEREEFW